MTAPGEPDPLTDDVSSSLRPLVVLLVAYKTYDGKVDEATPWREHFDFDREIDVDGIEHPVSVDTEQDVALVITGIGNVDAAVSVDALLTSPRIECQNAYFLTVGTAGASPAVATIGSVVINDYILDWDQKHRVSCDEERNPGREITTYSFKSTAEVCKALNPPLVTEAYEIASTVSLTDAEELDESAARSPPSVLVGASVSGSEFWHGSTCSSEAQYLTEEYGAGKYATTEMEGFGTAVALERHGCLDRYLSIRGIVNFDQPRSGQDVEESINLDGRALDVCVENVYRVGEAIISRIVDEPLEWIDDWAEHHPRSENPQCTSQNSPVINE